MSDRVTDLLLKAVRGLSPEEQDEVLAGLLAGRTSGDVAPASGRSGRLVAGRWIRPLGPSRPPAPAAPPDQAPPGPGSGAGPGADPPVDAGSRQRRLWAWPTPDAPTAGDPGADADIELRVLPVRLPVTDYERLRAFSREHGFSMAVIIRTLVERFLDGQVPQPEPGDG